jgi:6-phosphogluconate dehydrogenase
MSKPDDLSGPGGGYLIDKILDKTGMKGTGRWTIQEAAERNVPAPTMAAALDTRYLSARKTERVAASAILHGPTEIPNVERSQIIEDAKHALFSSKICSYAQGMCLIKAASDEVSHSLSLSASLTVAIFLHYALPLPSAPPPPPPSSSSVTVLLGC